MKVVVIVLTPMILWRKMGQQGKPHMVNSISSPVHAVQVPRTSSICASCVPEKILHGETATEHCSFAQKAFFSLFGL